MTTDVVSIFWKPKIARVLQVFGRGIEYALVSADNRQVHQFVYCKDFLQDTIHAYLNKTYLDMYNFKYDGLNSIPITLESTKILIASYRDLKFKHKIDLIVDFLNQFETRMKMKKTIAYICKSPMPTYKPSGVFMLEGSKRWMKAPALISLYTFLIRLGCSHTLGTSFENTLDGILNGTITPYQKTAGKDQYPDREYLKEAKVAIDWILTYGDRRMFYTEIKRNYPRKIQNFDEMHHNCGLVGFAKGDALEYYPYWYRLVVQNV